MNITTNVDFMFLGYVWIDPDIFLRMFGDCPTPVLTGRLITYTSLTLEHLC